MNLFVVFAVFAVIVSSSWNVDCAPFHWSTSSSSTTHNGNTITETNINGHRQVLINGRPVGLGMPPPGMSMGPMGPNMHPGMHPSMGSMGPMGPMGQMGPMGPMNMGPMGPMG